MTARALCLRAAAHGEAGGVKRGHVVCIVKMLCPTGVVRVADPTLAINAATYLVIREGLVLQFLGGG